MRISKRVLPILFILTLMGTVIYYIEPPKSWPEASILQILSFFIPMLLLFAFLINILLNHFAKSFALGLGLMFIAVLWAVGRLSLTSALTTAIATMLLFTLLPKSPSSGLNQSLTKTSKIPTLSKFRRIKL